MPTSYKILGQSNPAANTLTAVYTVPSATQAVISTISVCNQSASNASYSISVANNGAADNASQYVVRGGVVPAADSIGITLGITIDATDVVRCNTNSANISFNIFGSEIA
jgi:hypothetical protein